MSYTFDGIDGSERIKKIMTEFRTSCNGHDVINPISVEDYKDELFGLPSSDVLKFSFKDGSVVVRPSGTEPKLKIYLSAIAKDGDTAAAVLNKLKSFVEIIIKA